MLRFLQQIFASLIGTLAALLILSTLGVGALSILFIAALTQEETGMIKDKSILVFDLSLNIQDTEPPLSLVESLSEETPSAIALRQVIENLEKAAQDDRIVGIFLDGSSGSMNTGYATLKEVRAALEQFKASGKKIIAYDVDMSEPEYYLTSLADQIILNPMGALEINGLSSEQMFLTGALEKFGIGVQVVRVGKYKAAVEPLIQEQLSPENREQLNQLLQDLWGEFLTVTSQSRKLPVSQLQTSINQKGILLAPEAVQAKLVDQVAYYDEVATQLKELTGQTDEKKSFRQVSLKSYTDVTVEAVTPQTSENKIAVVYAEGPIVYGSGEQGQIGSDRLVKQLRKLRQDEKVKALVFRVNSPGGSATASEMILRELQLFGEDKPIIVSMGNVAASGGYWIATAADYIFAEPNTITGSIGVFGVLTNVAEISQNNGITWDNVKTSPFADISSISRPKTDAELAIIQNSVNRIYDLFLEKVAKARNLPKTKVAEIAQGRVWSGQSAKNIGLVDELGGIESAIAYAAQKAELGEDWEAEEYREEPSFEELLWGAFRVENSQIHTQNSQTIPREWSRLQQELKTLLILNDPRDIYSHLPFDLRIN